MSRRIFTVYKQIATQIKRDEMVMVPFWLLNPEFRKNLARNMSYDYTVPTVKVRIPSKGKCHSDSEIAYFSYAEKNTGISRLQLANLRRQFRLLEEGKANNYEIACERMAHIVAGHLNLSYSAQHIKLAKLDIMKSSKEILREANKHARARTKNYLAGVVGAAACAGLAFIASRLFENDRTETAIMVSLVGLLGVFIGVQTPHDAFSDLKECQIQVAYNARAAVIDAY